MKTVRHLLCLILLSLIPNLLLAEQTSLRLGVDREEIYGPILTGKKVALMVNQSSEDSSGEHTIDKLLALQSKYRFEVVKLFSVEHGIRGDKEAGFGDNTHLDAKSSLPVIPLYGRDSSGRSRKNPTSHDLQDVDIVIYDLQDVGVRFYTYTLSLHYLLDSLQANNKALVIFDRPNPLGDTLYGPILKEENISGIGFDPIPMVHGLTVGEFALMMVNEKWLTHFDYTSWNHHGRAEWQFPIDNLHIIKMENYRHDQPYFPPIPPSPNLRTPLAIKLYPSLALFEATSLNTGRGTNTPFEVLGFSDPNFYINTCYHVDPSIAKAGWPQAGKQVCGIRFTELNENINPTLIYFIEAAFWFHSHHYRLSVEDKEEPQYLKNQDTVFISRPLWLKKLVGDSQFLPQIEQCIQENKTAQQCQLKIEQSWQNELRQFSQLKEHYRLY